MGTEYYVMGVCLALLLIVYGWVAWKTLRINRVKPALRTVYSRKSFAHEEEINGVQVLYVDEGLTKAQKSQMRESTRQFVRQEFPS